MNELQKKLSDFIEKEIIYLEKNGWTKFSTCSHYNWDRDIWNYLDEIITAFRSRGYSVSTSVNWGVTDVIIKKSIKL